MSNPTIFTLEDLFDNLFKGVETHSVNPTEQNAIVNSFVDCDYPYNVIKDDKSNLIFEIALAGVSDEMLDISKEGSKITIKIGKVDEKTNVVYLAKKIKLPATEDKFIRITPTSKYDTDKVFANFTNGLLKISVPLKEQEKITKIKLS